MIQTYLPLLAEQPAYDGHPAKLVTLVNANGMRLLFMDIGATWLSCQVPVEGDLREVLLGVSSMEAFQKQTSYLGATVGRYANRIANSQFELDNITYHVTANQGKNCLHGGQEGWSHLRWKITILSEQSVRFTIDSEDGDQGFPGHIVANMTVVLTDDNEVRLDYHATTDAKTPINMTNHAYFNLMGAESGATVLEDTLCIHAQEYLPTTDMGIPLASGLTDVAGTSFDFREPTVIGSRLLADEQQKLVKGYDHSYFLGNPTLDNPVATLTAADGAVSVNVFTDKPAVQLYTGNWLEGTPNRVGGVYHDYYGVALETQFLPDSPNREWPHQSCYLEPNDEYHFTTVYQFC